MTHDPLAADLRNMVWLIWQHLNLPEPTKIQYDICDWLQNGPPRRMVMGFRGVGKSWLTAAYVIWLLYRDPRARILVISANKDKAVEFSSFVRRLIEEIDAIKHLRPREDTRDSVLAFDVGPAPAHQAPSVRATGIGGQITGGRASHIILDDVEVPKNSLTQTMRDQLAEKVKECAAVLMPDSDLAELGMRGEIVYLGTPQTESSIYAALPARGYSLRIWPARVPAKKDVYAGRLAPIIDTLGIPIGAPVEPSRFGPEDLAAREAEYGKAGFALQFMLDTTLSDADRYPLKLADAMIMGLSYDEAPAKVIWAGGKENVAQDVPAYGMEGDRWHRPAFKADQYFPYQMKIMAVDPAGRGGDELAYVILGMLNGFIYVLDWRGLRGGYSDQNLEYLVQRAKVTGVKQIVVEPNFGDGMFNELLKPVLARLEYPCSVVDSERSNAQKERRICDTLEPVLGAHRLIFDEQVVRKDADNYNNYPADNAYRYSAIYQMTRMTRDKGALSKDDRIDVLALGVAEFQKVMAKDVRKIEQETKDKLWDAEVRRLKALTKAKPSGLLSHAYLWEDPERSSDPRKRSSGRGRPVVIGSLRKSRSSSRG